MKCRKHHDLIVRWAKNQEAEVYVWWSGKWQKTAAPHWYSCDRYRVIEPEYFEAWDLFLRGELELFINGVWVLAKNAPLFEQSPENYRKAYHVGLRKQWQEHGGEVWALEAGWRQYDNPSWGEHLTYKLVEPEYKDLWQAYLDGVLEIDGFDGWQKWVAGVPRFNDPPSNYRRAGAHANERALAEANPNAEVWVKRAGCDWQRTILPVWHTNSQYKVVLPEYKVLWLLYLRGELQELKQGAWHTVEGVPALDRPLDRYRPKHHADKYKLARNRTDASVWVCGEEKFKIWEVTDEPKWRKDLIYRVILPEHKDLWQAYLDGTLLFRGGCGWGLWSGERAPQFNASADRYKVAEYNLEYKDENGKTIRVFAKDVKHV